MPNQPNQSKDDGDNKLNDNLSKNNNLRKIIKPNKDELKLHHNYLKSSLKKNYYN